MLGLGGCSLYYSEPIPLFRSNFNILSLVRRTATGCQIKGDMGCLLGIGWVVVQQERLREHWDSQLGTERWAVRNVLAH